MVSFNIQNNEENGLQIGNNNSRNRAAAGNNKKEKKPQIKNGRVFAGNSNLPQDSVAMKRIKAGKDAMKGVIDKFTSDKKTDDNLAARKQHIQELQAENDKSSDQIKEFNELKNHLREEYEISDDSQEQKDLELLVKEMNSHKKGAPKLTIEEQKQFESMGPQTEYQGRILNFEKGLSEIKDQMNQANNGIRGETSAIAATKQAMLKSKTHGMIDDAIRAEDIREAASKEIVGMLLDEAKQHVDEEVAKNKEEADKIAEEKAEKEKAEEAAKAAAQGNPGSETTNNKESITLNKGDQDTERLQKEIQEIILKNKLLEDDIKGVVVDKQM